MFKAKKKQNNNFLDNKNNQSGNGIKDGQAAGQTNNPDIQTTPPPKIDIKQYQDPEGLTVGKMNLGLWLVEHRKELFTIPVVILAVISAITWIYSLYGFGYYLIWGREQDRQLVDDLLKTNIPGHDFFLSISPRPLVTSQAQVIAAEENDRYDFYAQVNNPNKNHWGYFSYNFIADGQDLPPQTAFVLPGESKYIFTLNQELKKKPAANRLNIFAESWQRIDKHEYQDWNNFAAEHLDITVADIKFLPAKSTLLSEKLSINELNFTATNQTAFNYREVNFSIALMRQNEIVGVNVFLLRDFLSGQSRPVSLAWPGRLGRVDDIKIKPELDITRDDIYLDFTGEQNSLGQTVR